MTRRRHPISIVTSLFISEILINRCVTRPMAYLNKELFRNHKRPYLSVRWLQLLKPVHNNSNKIINNHCLHSILLHLFFILIIKIMTNHVHRKDLPKVRRFWQLICMSILLLSQKMKLMLPHQTWWIKMYQQSALMLPRYHHLSLSQPPYYHQYQESTP